MADQDMKVVETSPDGTYERFDKKLGSGAYKDVYLSLDTDRGVEVAWNTVSLRRLPANERVRIRGETKILKQLKHKNIIDFYKVWDNEEKQEICFTTEIMTSGTLKQFASRTKLRLKVVKRWCRQIVDGLLYLHQQNPPIIHRDLKCDNIFVNGNIGEVRIGDFGLSAARATTHVESVLGTPEFMAPELYEEKYSEKVDIYAFGMCVLEMVTREYPYEECKSAAQIWNKVTCGHFPEVIKRIRNAQVRSFIELCLQKQEHRPSAQDLLEHPFLAYAYPGDNQTVEVDPKPDLDAAAADSGATRQVDIPAIDGVSDSDTGSNNIDVNNTANGNNSAAEDVGSDPTPAPANVITTKTTKHVTAEDGSTTTTTTTTTHTTTHAPAISPEPVSVVSEVTEVKDTAHTDGDNGHQHNRTNSTPSAKETVTTDQGAEESGDGEGHVHHDTDNHSTNNNNNNNNNSDAQIPPLDTAEPGSGSRINSPTAAETPPTKNPVQPDTASPTDMVVEVIDSSEGSAHVSLTVMFAEQKMNNIKFDFEFDTDTAAEIAQEMANAFSFNTSTASQIEAAIETAITGPRQAWTEEQARRQAETPSTVEDELAAVEALEQRLNKIKEERDQAQVRLKDIMVQSFKDAEATATDDATLTRLLSDWQKIHPDTEIADTDLKELTREQLIEWFTLIKSSLPVEVGSTPVPAAAAVVVTTPVKEGKRSSPAGKAKHRRKPTDEAAEPLDETQRLKKLKADNKAAKKARDLEEAKKAEANLNLGFETFSL